MLSTSAAGLLLMGSLFGHHNTFYKWDSVTVDGDSLYVMKMDVYYAPNIPIPERGADVVLKKDYEVVKLDLTGKKHRLLSTKYHLVPKRPINDESLADVAGYYEYIEVDDKGQTILWGTPELKQRLLKVIPAGCSADEFGHVEYDKQDSRVLYLYCQRMDTAYRVELPEMNVVAIPFGRPYDPNSFNSSPRFYSMRGQKTVFVDVAGAMYELNTDDLTTRKKMEMVESGNWNADTRSDKSLIGVAQGLRIYQVKQTQTNAAQLSIEYQGQPARVYPLPNAIAHMFGPAIYLPRSNLVLWNAWDENPDNYVIFTFNIETGVMRQAYIPKMD
jgi:hypothetical protein